MNTKPTPEEMEVELRWVRVRNPTKPGLYAVRLADRTDPEGRPIVFWLQYGDGHWSHGESIVLDDAEEVALRCFSRGGFLDLLQRNSLSWFDAYREPGLFD